VRHAQTAWNSQNRLQGHSDLPLDPHGLLQAQRLGEYFAPFNINQIYTSTLQRSQQTALAIAQGLAKPLVPVKESELVEISLGQWEGLSPEEINTRYNGAYQQWIDSPASVCIEGAETAAAFYRRVEKVLGVIVAASVGDDAENIVVAHGGVIAAMLAIIVGADYESILKRVRLDNAGITSVEATSNGLQVLSINQIVSGQIKSIISK